MDLAQLLAEQYKLDPTTTLMVGDRLNTDIKFGNQMHWSTLLVLTGCHKRRDIDYEDKGAVPDFVTESFADLIRILDENDG